MAIDVSEKTFEAEVLKSDVPVVVDFGAKWCGPCRKLIPVLDEIENAYQKKIKIVKVDADENKELLQQCSISGLPCLLIFKNGKAVERMAGMMPKSSILSNIEKHI